MTTVDCNYQGVAASSSDLPGLITERRQELGLSVSQAAKLADVDRATWTKWEKGKSRPFDSSYVKIERALQWAPRHVSEIMAGRAGEHSPPPVPPPPADIAVDPLDWAAMTGEERAMFVNILRSARRRRQSA